MDMLRRIVESMSRAMSMEPPITLREYQQKVLTFLGDAISAGHGGVYCLRQSRQSGKNEISAYHHYRVLMDTQKGDYLAFSPTYNQTLISKRRLEKYINHFGSNIPVSGGRTFGRSTRLTFLTASPTGNILGHTASLGMTIDEAQDVDKNVFETKILPMTASTAAPIIMVGTAGFSNDILYEAIQYNIASGHPERNLSIPAPEVAVTCDAYASHYLDILNKYGKSSILVRTQYDLVDCAAGGGLLTEEQVLLLTSSEPSYSIPKKGVMYIAAIDVGGSSTDETPDNDMTVFMVAEMALGETVYDRPSVKVVHVETMQGVKYDQQEMRLNQLLSLWNPLSVVADARGVGDMLVENLAKRYPILTAYKATAQSVSYDIHSMLGYINRGLLVVANSQTIDQARLVGYKSSSGNLSLIKSTSSSKIDCVKCLSYLPRAIDNCGMFKFDNIDSPI